MNAGTKGLIAVLAGVTSVALGVAYYKSQQKHSGTTPPPPTCPSTCSTDSDCSGCGSDYVCLNGVCVQQTAPPPTCPNSCSADSDCSGCGPDFVCENGQCIKQIPATISAPLSANMASSTLYTTTCCFTLFYNSCIKCMPTYKPGAQPATFDVYVRDSSGRGIPNVKLSIASSVASAGLQFTFTLSNGQQITPLIFTSGQTALITTDAEGKVTITVEADTMPVGWDNVANSNYPCSACSDITDQGTVGPLSFGQFNFTVLDVGGLSAVTLLTDTVTYMGIINEVTGCPCL